MKTDVTSANFKFSGNSLFDIALSKTNYKVFAVTSALFRSIFGGILLCVVALFGFKPLILFLMSDSISGAVYLKLSKISHETDYMNLHIQVKTPTFKSLLHFLESKYL